MRRVAFAVLLACGAPLAQASMLLPVADSEGYCARVDDGFCHEWALEADTRIRVVFSGFEDGASYSLYRRVKFGRYRHLLDFEPVLQDGDGDGLRLEYLGDATDIDLATTADRDIVVYASFEVPWERYVDSDLQPLPRWQQRKPALLFKQTATRHASPVPRQHFAPMTLGALRKAAKRVRVGCTSPNPIEEGMPQPCR